MKLPFTDTESPIGDWQEFWKAYPEELKCQAALEERLGYIFVDRSLLYQAMVHRSALIDYQEGGGGLEWNERIEFLGDSVLGLIISDRLWHSRTALSEGQMSVSRSALVSEEFLSQLAQQIELAGCIALGRAEQASGGRSRSGLLADSLEALVGAIYLDAGFERAREIVSGLFSPEDVDERLQGTTDYKTALQELIQERSKETPTYHVESAEGPDHAKVFAVEVRVAGEAMGRGYGSSKKRASKEAARSALEALSD